MSQSVEGLNYEPDWSTYSDKVVYIPEPILAKPPRETQSKTAQNVGWIILGVVVLMSVLFLIFLPWSAKIWAVLFFLLGYCGVRIFAFKEIPRRKQFKEFRISDNQVSINRLWNITSSDHRGIVSFPGGGYGFAFRLVPGAVLGKSNGDLFEGRSLETELVDRVHKDFEDCLVRKIDTTRESGRSEALNTIQENANNAELPVVRNLMKTFASRIENEVTSITVVEIVYFVYVRKRTKEEIWSVMRELNRIAAERSASLDVYRGIEFLSSLSEIGDLVSNIYGLQDTFDYSNASYQAVRSNKVPFVPVSFSMENGKKFFIEIGDNGEVRGIEPAFKEES